MTSSGWFYCCPFIFYDEPDREGDEGRGSRNEEGEDRRGLLELIGCRENSPMTFFFRLSTTRDELDLAYSISPTGRMVQGDVKAKEADSVTTATKNYIRSGFFSFICQIHNAHADCPFSGSLLSTSFQVVNLQLLFRFVFATRNNVFRPNVFFFRRAGALWFVLSSSLRQHLFDLFSPGHWDLLPCLPVW